MHFKQVTDLSVDWSSALTTNFSNKATATSTSTSCSGYSSPPASSFSSSTIAIFTEYALSRSGFVSLYSIVVDVLEVLVGVLVVMCRFRDGA